MVREFNKNYPYVTVELVSGDDEADVSIGSPFDLSELLQKGAILSLDPFVEGDEAFDLSDFYPGTVGLCTREDKLWAIPAGMDMLVLYYNRDLFDAYGVPYPESGWTWDDFLDKAKALRDPEAGVFGYGVTDQYLDPLPFIYQHGGRILDDMQNPTRTTFDDPLTVEAVEWYAGLILDHNVAPTRNQVLGSPFNGSAQAGVYLNKVGMWIGWLSERGGGGGAQATWPAQWKMKWGMAPLPRDAQSAMVAYVLGYAISSKSPAPEACWHWIAFLSRQVQAPYDLTPARSSLARSTAYTQLVGGDVAAIARESMENAVLLSPALFEFVRPYIYGNASEAIVNGRSTPQEALSEAQQRAAGR